MREQRSAHDAWSRDMHRRRTDEVGYEEEDVLLVGLGGARSTATLASTTSIEPRRRTIPLDMVGCVVVVGDRGRQEGVHAICAVVVEFRAARAVARPCPCTFP